jgi:hypothetical protein
MCRASELSAVVRHVAERLHMALGWGPGVGGLCVVSALALRDMLRAEGIQASLIGGAYGPRREGHCWIVLADGSYVDPTADQFGVPIDHTSIAAGDARRSNYRAIARDEEALRRALTLGTQKVIWGHARYGAFRAELGLAA